MENKNTDTSNKQQTAHLGISVVIGSFVRFYDCQKANLDKDYSGTKNKYYPIGEVIYVYDYKSEFGYTDEVCDIKIGNRISKGHFTRGVTVVS